MFSRVVALLKDLLEHSEVRRQSIELQQLLSQLDELKMSMSDIKAEWDDYLDTLLAVPTETGQSMSYRVEPSQSGSRGRPPFQVQKEQLEYLSSLGFTWSKIASLLGVSRMTIFIWITLRSGEHFKPFNYIFSVDLVSNPNLTTDIS